MLLFAVYCAPTFEKITVKVKKNILLFFSFVCLSAYSQHIEWAKNVSLPIKKGHFINNNFCFTGISNDTLKIDSMNYHWYPHPYSYMASINKNGTIDSVLHLSDIYPLDFTGDNNAYYIAGGQWSFCMSKSELNSNIPWSKCYDCSGCSHYPSVAAVSLIKHKNSLYVVGSYEDNLFIGNQWIYANNYSSLLTKVDPVTGNIIWVRNIPRSIIKIIDLNDETFLMGTALCGNSSFDSIAIQTNHCGIIISRIDTAGNFISAKLIIEGDGTKMKDMVIDSDKNIFITGSFVDSCKMGTTAYAAINGGFFLVKTDSIGTILWAKVFSEPLQSVYGTGPWSLCVTPDNSVCLTGTFHHDSLDLHDTILYKIGNGENAFLAKYSSNGQFISVISIHSTGYCYVNEVTSDDDGALYWWGWYRGQVQIGNHIFQSHGGYNYSSYLVKIGAGTIDTATAPFILSQTHSNILCNGQCTGSVILKAIGGTPPYFYSGPNSGLCAGTYIFSATDSNGNNATTTVTITQPDPIAISVIAANASTYINSNTDLLTGTPSGGIFSGVGVSGTNFDPSLAGIGTWQITYIYTGGNGCTDTATINITVDFSTSSTVNGGKERTFEVYPNPTYGIFTVNLKHTKVETKICVYDALGKCVLDKVSMKTNEEKIDLTGQPKGVYSLEIESNGKNEVKKIVLQ